MEKKMFDFALPTFLTKKVNSSERSENFFSTTPAASPLRTLKSPRNVKPSHESNASSPEENAGAHIPAFLRRSISSPSSSDNSFLPSTTPEFIFTPKKKISFLRSEISTPERSTKTDSCFIEKENEGQTGSLFSRGNSWMNQNDSQRKHDSIIGSSASVGTPKRTLSFECNKSVSNEVKFDIDEIDNRDLVLPLSTEGKTLKKQLLSLINQFLSEGDKICSSLIVENSALKKELGLSKEETIALRAQLEKVTIRTSELSIERESLSDQLTILQDKIHSLENHIEESKSFSQGVSDQLEEKGRELEKALEKISSIDQQLGISEEKFDALKAEHDLLIAERQIETEKCVKLSEEVKTLQETILSLELKMSTSEGQYRENLDTCQSQLENERNSHKNTEAALIEAQANLEAAKKDLTIHSEEIANLNIGRCKVEDQLKDFENQYETCKQSLSSALEMIATLESSFKSTKAQIQPLNLQLENTSFQLSNATKEIASLQEENTSMRSQLETVFTRLKNSEEKYQLELNNTRQQLNSEKAIHDETRTRFEVCKDQLKTERNRLSLELSEFQNQKELMENELAKAQGRLATAERSSETRREHISALKNELEISRMEIAELESDRNKHLTQKKELENLFNDLRVKSALLEEELKAELQKCKEELKSQQEMYQLNATPLFEFTKLKNEKSANEERIAKMQIIITARENDMEKLKEENVSLNERLVSYEENLNFFREKCQFLLAEYYEAIGMAKDLNTEVHTLNKKLEVSKGEAKSVDKEVESLIISVTELVGVHTTQVETMRLLSNAEVEAESLKDALKQAVTGKCLLENLNHTLLNEKDKVIKELKVLQERIIISESTQEKLRYKNSSLKDAMTASSQHILDLQHHVHTMESDLATYKGKAERLAFEKSRIEKQLETTQLRLIEHERELRRRLEKHQSEAQNLNNTREYIDDSLSDISVIERDSKDDNKTLEKVDDRLEKPVVETNNVLKGVSLQHSTVDKAKGERCKSAKSPDTVEEGNVDSPVVIVGKANGPQERDPQVRKKKVSLQPEAAVTEQVRGLNTYSPELEMRKQDFNLAKTNADTLLSETPTRHELNKSTDSDVVTLANQTSNKTIMAEDGRAPTSSAKPSCVARKLSLKHLASPVEKQRSAPKPANTELESPKNTPIPITEAPRPRGKKKLFLAAAQPLFVSSPKSNSTRATSNLEDSPPIHVSSAAKTYARKRSSTARASSMVASYSSKKPRRATK